jgi:membrane-bound serine protease (ClpP class)
VKRRVLAGAPLLTPLLLLLLGAAPTPTTTPTRTPAADVAAGPGDVLLLVVDGMINLGTADYLRQGIATAADGGAAAVVLQLDTPGGLLEPTKLIVKEMLGTPVPIIVYVAPAGASATSAGVFVTMAANVAVMAPGTSIGAAHPVGGQGENIDSDMRAKVENFTVSLVRTIAQQRNRNGEWAEKAVRESVSITEREAVKLKVVDFVADNLTDLLTKAHGRTVEVEGRKVVLNTANAPVRRYAMSLRQRVLDLLSHPNIAYLLMMAGLLGLYVEFTNPGVVFPGVAGAICLLLAMAVLQVLPVNYTALALIGLGMAMLIAEAFLPSFGVIGVGGLVAFVLGSLLLFDTPESTIRVDRGLIAGAAITLGAFSLTVGWLVVRSQRQRSVVGADGMLSEIGEVRRVVVPGRQVKVFVHGEYWDADTDEALGEGDRVEIVGVNGLRLRVRRAAG